MVAVNQTAAFAYVPNLATVEYSVRSGDGTYDTAEPITAFRTRVSLAEQQPSGGFYEKFRCSFKLSLDDLAGVPITPQPGDKLTDADNDIWTVLHCHKGQASWAVGCLRFVVWGHTVNYIRVSSASSSTTARTVTTNTGSPLTCAIQPQVREVTDIFGTKATPETYLIWLYEGVGQPINAGDMLEDEEGTIYEILAVSDRKRLDELSMFTCIKKL